jgi:cytochrome b pre-mRNA-processing protein 3
MQEWQTGDGVPGREGRRMIFGLFRRRDPNAATIERLYEAVSEAARRPAFYRDLGVPDTVEGRFEMLTLHAHLVVRRLRALPDPASDLAQDLVDRIFAGFDAALRELGVGDITVPKRMKTLASAFLGRAKAYEAALADDAQLREALRRNVYGNAAGCEAHAATMAMFVRRTIQALDGAGFDDFTAGRLPLPEPGRTDEEKPS